MIYPIINNGRVAMMRFGASHLLSFFLLLGFFVLQAVVIPGEARAAITQPGAWTQAINVATQSGTYTYTAGTGSSRVVVVTITSTHTTAAAYSSPAITYGGTALTLAKGDTTTALRNHTAVYYLPEASIPAGAQTLSVNTGIANQHLYVNVATFAGVDQTTPIDASQNANRNTDGVTALFGTALTINANDQAILVTNLYNHTDASAISGYATPTGWSAAALSNNGTTTNAWYFFVNNYASIPTSTTTTTASWGTNLAPGTLGFSMTGVSLKMATASVPTVTSTSPNTMAQGAGPTTVTITGTNFTGATAVSFNNANITTGTITVVSATSITVPVTVAPATTTGAKNVSVTTPGGTGTGTGVFTVTAAPAPTVTSTSPNTMAQGTGPTTVTITGTNFLAGATVSFNDANITTGTVTVVSATSITVPVTVAAATTTGAKNVTVSLPGGQSGTGTGVFTVSAAVPAPTVTSTSPNTMVQGAGPTTVTITGTNFTGATAVSFNDATITTGAITVVSATSITVPVTVAPATTTGAKNVSVTTPGGTGTGTGVFTVTAAPAPTVTSTSPSSMAQGTGPTTVTITGTNFLAGATVSFNDANITTGTVTVVSATSITVPVTVAAATTTGAKNVTVSLLGGQSGTGTGVFTVTAGTCVRSAPTVTFSPTSASIPLGNNLAYTLSVKNNDNLFCSASTFTIAVGSETGLAASFTLPSTLGSVTTGALAQGATYNTTLTVTVKSGGTAGATNTTTINVTDATNHSAQPGSGSVISTASLTTFDMSTLHNANRFGTCSVAAYSGTSQATCTAQGGTWTATSKWAGNWGLAAGKYGAFSCSTCHSANSSNIKRVNTSFATADSTNWGSNNAATVAVTFTNVTSLVRGMGDDTRTPNTSSTHVCEVCHSANKYHNYNVANNTGGTSHNNGKDCTGCHPHKTGFLGKGHSVPYYGSVHNSAAGGSPFSSCTVCHTNTKNAAYPYPQAVGVAPDCQNCHIKAAPYGNTAKCDSCHGSAAATGVLIGAPVGGGTFPDAQAGQHANHLNGTFATATCLTCHPVTTGNTGHGWSNRSKTTAVQTQTTINYNTGTHGCNPSGISGCGTHTGCVWY